MASPISLTIELRRCWTTDRVMGSILADIFALLFTRYSGNSDLKAYLIVAAGDV